ncbi:MAG: phosphate acetyltransferase [Christensenellales bacterium]|jgi:phosphate acetyltransferase
MKDGKRLIKLAKQKQKTIVFPEAGFSDRIVEAVKIIVKKKIAKVILIADESAMAIRFKNLKNVTIINPKTSHLAGPLAEKLFEIRKEKGVTQEKAKELILNPFYFSVMLVKEGYADGMVAGAEVSTSTTLKPALEIIKTKTGLASSCMVFFGKHKTVKLPLVLADPGFVPNPSEKDLVEIAHQTTQTVSKLFKDLTPKVAFISYSTKGSANSEFTQKMVNATKIFKEKHPNILADGEMQLDAALIPFVANKKCALSPVAGQANILIVPDLNVGNAVYKAIQYFGFLNAIGPVVQGLNKPVNDLSRGCSVSDIVLLTALTVLQATEETK